MPCRQLNPGESPPTDDNGNPLPGYATEQDCLDNSPCGTSVCCSIPYRTMGGNDPSTEMPYPDEGSALAACEGSSSLYTLSPCYAIPTEGGFLWKRFISNGNNFGSFAQPNGCVDGCDDCQETELTLDSPDTGTINRCVVSGKSCADNPCNRTEWYANCAGEFADCTGCRGGPFESLEEGNQWISENPPPDGCAHFMFEYTNIPPRN